MAGASRVLCGSTRFICLDAWLSGGTPSSLKACPNFQRPTSQNELILGLRGNRWWVGALLIVIFLRGVIWYQGVTAVT
ncbi:hypothetical protein BDV30DRAFT_201760 [Aspergillus minisclerotigenes]|uniref:Uncharacterized protein n=1 Tax=Aspergillus minisclerotigenes TaxID=656917 RepID=A0A5N6JKW4_9EURO|nr:hypothetical protein BDV30DRAFT_201760 [Aspergillus minisclerotigenes]